MPQSVTLERRERTAILSIVRPVVHNAIDAEVAEAIADHAADLSRDQGVGALVVRGTGGRAFSAGADLATVAELSGAAKRRYIESCWRALDDLSRLPMPTIAAIEGYALGGGLELALACDLRVADPKATLGLPELALGGVPSFGAVQRLPAIVGRGRALDLVLRGRRIDGAEAERIGLVSIVSAPGGAVEEALELATVLSSRTREAVRYLKLGLDGFGGRGGAELHGLISDLCHSEPAYRAQIARFARTEPDATDEF